MILAQPALLDVPMVALAPVAMHDANRLLLSWGHRLGPVNRPFSMQGFALFIDAEPISVAVSASTVSDTVAGFGRTQVVECARLCAEPGNPWANRVMLRLWREACAPRWPDWPVLAAVSYSQNAHHPGNLYRFDGWTLVKTDAGTSSRGGAWTRKRYATDAVSGPKSLWLWRYPVALNSAAAGVP